MINKKVFFFGYKSTRWDGYKCTRVLYTTGYFCTRSYISAPDPADFRPDPDPDPSRRHPGDVRPDPDPRPSRIRILDWARSGSGQIRSWSGFWMMMILSRIRIRWDSLQVTIKRTWIRIIDRNNEKGPDPDHSSDPDHSLDTDPVFEWFDQGSGSGRAAPGPLLEGSISGSHKKSNGSGVMVHWRAFLYIPGTKVPGGFIIWMTNSPVPTGTFVPGQRKHYRVCQKFFWAILNKEP